MRTKKDLMLIQLDQLNKKMSEVNQSLEMMKNISLLN